MKILYSCGNLNGSNIRLSHFLNHTNHDVKISAYYYNNSYLNKIHWLLDPLSVYDRKSAKNLTELAGFNLKVNERLFNNILDDIIDYNPDIILSDFEPYAACISKLLEIPLISCSPLHLLDGVVWKGEKTRFENEKNILKAFSDTTERLIYSPFGSLINPPELLPGFDWITPYPVKEVIEPRDTYNINNFIKKNNSTFSTGNSQNIYSQMLSGKSMCIADSPSNPEEFLNAFFVEYLNLGVSIGDSKNKGIFFNSKIECLEKINPNYLLNKNRVFLHERLNYDLQ